MGTIQFQHTGEIIPNLIDTVHDNFELGRIDEGNSLVQTSHTMQKIQDFDISDKTTSHHDSPVERLSSSVSTISSEKKLACSCLASSEHISQLIVPPLLRTHQEPIAPFQIQHGDSIELEEKASLASLCGFR